MAMPLQEEIAKAVSRSLRGTGLQFAVIIWAAGRPDDSDGISIAADHRARAELPTACRTAADIAEFINAPGGKA